MSFDPKDFLKLSRNLISDVNYNTQESVFRTSISRAYYSAFLVCRSWLETKGFRFPPTSDVHEKVIKYLRRRNVYVNLNRKTSAVADVLAKLRRDGRNEADYNLQKNFKINDVSKWIRDAEYVINAIP
ncbi:MAG: HEPN domain-containing protein [Candidatus Jordarchaeum sp.]|uniref:HEPN domain-containing protein n=1 Tax=Candidatus Jordarchaeum sp. TaxID=2823881 RepID=UPI0040492D50